MENEDLPARLRNIGRFYVMSPGAHATIAEAAAALSAAEAKVDALREALAPFAGCIFNDNGDITVNFRAFTAENLIAAYFAHKRARALTQEQNNG